MIEKYAKFRRNVLEKSKNTVYSDIQTLKKLCNHILDKPFNKVTKEDMIRFFGDIEQIQSILTRDFYTTILIHFY